MFRKWNLQSLVTGMIVMLIVSSAPGWAQNVKLSAEVDKTEVRFGESLSLYLTLSHEVQGYSGQRLSAPDVQRIPGFDIVGRRTAQSMNFVNGVGQVQMQTVFELVPDGPGEKTIPGFSVNLPGGQTASSLPIAVKVLPPAKEDASAPGDDDSEERAPRGVSFWRGLAIVGMVVGLIIAFPIFLSMLLTRNVKPSTRWKKTEETPVRTVEPEVAGIGTRPSRASADEEPAQIILPPTAVDFGAEVNALKRLHPETDLEFYRAFFDLFHRALIGASRQLKEHMTPDELARVLCAHFPVDRQEALKRVVADWESVVFARTRPGRSFQHVHDDSAAILTYLRSQETQP